MSWLAKFMMFLLLLNMVFIFQNLFEGDRVGMLLNMVGALFCILYLRDES